MLQARSCTPDFSSEQRSPDSAFQCHQQMDYSPVPVKGHFSEGGLTSPRGQSPSLSSAYGNHHHGLAFVSHQPFGCGVMQAPLASMQTPIRPPLEVDYCEKLARLLKSKNDFYRTEASPPITQLSDYLFVGGIPSQETAQFMSERAGITHVINLIAQEIPTRPYISNAFTTSDIHAVDTVDYYIILYHYEQFAHIVNQVRAAGGKVFVHCFAGVNRSVALCTAYLLDHHDHLEPADIVQQMHNQQRFYVLDNVGFQQQLVEFYFREVVPKRQEEEAPVVRFHSMDGHN
ncbi:dual specificity protein phosphatase, putative [Bodo saltans]|uniref:Dual specificity protein phosphatase, putative n=1 Tax=Bodo saltans TaxID=75058 RepID=A0A0S4JQR8_BODSA|nr:dual specificity protein phosphatase, putative [Bodo saltans]|eukprot:CUG92671.1 dual specificity protein phosphatase, putative [Bodo saltans]